MQRVAVPPKMSRLPVDKHGRPIPWFVAEVNAAGDRDFRVADQARRLAALRFGHCWVCGQQVGGYKAFVLGPMCAVNRITAEPACHRECALYSVQACPFLVTPQMVRRPIAAFDEGELVTPGEMITRNPGVTLVWVTRGWRPVRVDNGVLIGIGDPTETLWFAQGRPASAHQAREAIVAGLPALLAATDRDADPVASRRDLDRCVAAAYRLLPPE